MFCINANIIYASILQYLGNKTFAILKETFIIELATTVILNKTNIECEKWGTH